MSAREPLGPDEQALAARLREWSVAEPSAALDARILAQARAAVARPVRRPRPLLIGLASAATLVLAVGVVWRVLEAPPAVLAPVPEAMPQMRGAGADAAVPGAGHAPSAPAAVSESTPDDVVAPAPVQRQRDAPTRQRAAGTGGPAATAPPPAPPPPPPEPAAPVADMAQMAERPAEPVAAPAAAAPAPAAPPVPAPRDSESDAGAGRAPPEPATRRLGPATTGRAQGGAVEARRERDNATGEAPAAAIERIRALVAAGELALAREQLALLRERMPDLVLPSDLQALADQPRR